MIFFKGNIMPAQDDPPLNLNVPKPSFAKTRSRSAFGFQSTMAISETVPTDRPRDSEYHEDSDMADIYADEVNENANITNEGADEAEDGLGAMNDGGNGLLLSLSMGSHSLPEPEDHVQANIEAGNLGLSLRKKYNILILISSRTHRRTIT
jgi:hypothetical protein